MVVKYLNGSGNSGHTFSFSKTTSRIIRLERDGDKSLEDQDGPDHIRVEPGTNPVMHGGRKNLPVD